MSRASVESDDGVLSRDQVNSPMSDKGKHGGNSDGGIVLKKGPWTSAEDAILVEYVKKHGEGNWNAVQKYSGLSRCGKSCRLRWANHLRPNLKKGAFSAEEERTIVELHAKMGNKWARMAAHLPGRTDNEIKNYWNTRIKRRQRAGLPLYPAELCMQSMQDCPQGSSYHGMHFGDKDDILQSSSYQIPDVVFDGLKASPSILPYVPELSDVSASSFLMKTFGSSQYGSLLPPAMHRPKRLRESTSSYPGFAGYAKDGFSQFHQYEDDTCEKFARSFAYSFPVDDPNDKNALSFGGVQGSHSLSNGNSSTSKPKEALKMELPSLQYPEPDLGSWDTSSPSPPSLLESIDKFIQSPPRTGKVEESECPSPCNNGLLESLVYEATKTLSSAKNPSPDKSSTSSTALTPGGGDISSSTTLDVCKSEWEEYGDPISPLGHSATSIFNEHTPVNPTLDEQQPVLNVKEEPIHQIQTPERDEVHCGDLSRPDALLASSDWFGLNSGGAFKDQEAAAAAAAMADPLASLLGDDLSSDYRQTSTTTTSDAYMDHQGWGLYAWNNMPAVCQMSELQ